MEDEVEENESVNDKEYSSRCKADRTKAEDGGIVRRSARIQKTSESELKASHKTKKRKKK